jgi:hypothetical protein
MTLNNKIGCDEIVQQFISGLSEYRDSMRQSYDIPELNESCISETNEEVLIDD